MDRRAFIRGAIATAAAPVGLVLGIKTTGVQPRTASGTITGRLPYKQEFAPVYRMYPRQEIFYRDWHELEMRVLSHMRKTYRA